jgi:hypothetical protein
MASGKEPAKPSSTPSSDAALWGIELREGDRHKPRAARSRRVRTASRAKGRERTAGPAPARAGAPARRRPPTSARFCRSPACARAPSSQAHRPVRSRACSGPIAGRSRGARSRRSPPARPRPSRSPPCSRRRGRGPLGLDRAGGLRHESRSCGPHPRRIRGSAPGASLGRAAMERPANHRDRSRRSRRRRATRSVRRRGGRPARAPGHSAGAGPGRSADRRCRSGLPNIHV